MLETHSSIVLKSERRVGTAGRSISICRRYGEGSLCIPRLSAECTAGAIQHLLSFLCSHG